MVFRATVILLALTLTSYGQDPNPNPSLFGEAAATNASESSTSFNVAAPSQTTPEMWFYMQEYRRYQSPKEAVRRKAQMRAQQRSNRLAAQRWFGFSNSRPQASPIPQMGTYSPTWQGNSWNPYSWVGTGQAVTHYVTRPTDAD